MAVNNEELFNTLDYIVSRFSEEEKAALLDELIKEHGRDTMLKLMFLTFCRDQILEIAEKKARLARGRQPIPESRPSQQSQASRPSQQSQASRPSRTSSPYQLSQPITSNSNKLLQASNHVNQAYQAPKRKRVTASIPI